MTTYPMYFDAACPHCTKEISVFVIAEPETDRAMIQVTEDEEAARERLAELMEEVQEPGPDGVSRGVLTYEGRGDPDGEG